jgi:hypothetical protein
MKIHVFLHNEESKVDKEIKELLKVVIKQGAFNMATSKEVLELANAVVAAVNTLEAKVTEALAKLPAVPADVQADLDAAFVALQGAVADAADGVDEAAVPPV